MILNVKSNKRNEFIEITRDVKKLVTEKGWKDGILVLTTLHTTAALTINENADPDVKKDLLRALDALVPDIHFDHYEGNSDSHLKSSLVGTDLTIIIEEGKLQLGTWQGIYFCEFDGPRNRKIKLKFIPS